MTACGAIGALTVGGREVAAFACDEDEGHGLVGIPHAYTLTWSDDSILRLPDADLFDPDERPDVHVPFGP